jgi:serine protease
MTLYRKFSISIIIIFLFTSFVQTYAEDTYVKNTIIVKFKYQTDELNKWLYDGRQGEFPEFLPMLGNHTSRGYISKSTLTLLGTKFNRNAKSSSSNQVDNLKRICIIQYTSPIDAKIAAKKISSYPWVEYAEPMPVRKIDAIPNDPRIIDQYYLQNIKAFDAWDYLDSTRIVIIGIVDTGVDYDHEDLAANIFINPGETGTDSLGNDKRTNGIDDDGNGFIDDWHGWDFVSSTGPNGQDNDPKPGHRHGTHVAGITAAVINNGIGIAGIAKYAKILPVKIGHDDPFGGSVENSYEGVLYAAAMGAGVINCSWGGPNRSQSEQEVITTAEGLGAVIVAAAGNDGSQTAFYPAAYKNVMSVAATDAEDKLTYFSNFHPTVDVSAPGDNIYSTVPPNPDSLYENMSGTSMASPVAAGVTALARLQNPGFTPLQIVEHVKATADNIDSLNPYYAKLIGKGRVNAFRAVTEKNTKSVILKDYSIIEQYPDGSLEPREKIDIKISLMNVLSPLKNVVVEVASISFFKPDFTPANLNLGDMATGETKDIDTPFSFIIPENIPLDYSMMIQISYKDDSGYSGSNVIFLQMQPSYKTMNGNNISTTITSAGNIAYNDYPNNLQGIGFRYKNSEDFLYEGALMIAVSPAKLSDVARGANQNYKDESFNAEEIITLEKKYPDLLVGSTQFTDLNDSSEAGVKVSQTVYQFDSANKKDFIIVAYDIINISGVDRDSLYAGLYFDWDMGPSGNDNITVYDELDNFGYNKHATIDTLPIAAAALLSPQTLNFFAMDNGGTTSDNPGVWDGFYAEEKWQTLTSGIGRRQSDTTDASMVIGAGPISIKNGDTARVVFSFASAYTMDDIKAAIRESRNTSIINGISDSIPSVINNSRINIYPNPVNTDYVNIDINITKIDRYTLDIIDILGDKISTIIDNITLAPCFLTRKFYVNNLSSGNYFIRLRTSDRIEVTPFSVIK